MGRRCLSHQGALFCTDSRNKGDRGREERKGVRSRETVDILLFCRGTERKG